MNGGKYESLCFQCISRDCVRSPGEDGPQYDDRYLNRCVLAVARRFRLNVKAADEAIYVKRSVLQWRHLEQ